MCSNFKEQFWEWFCKGVITIYFLTIAAFLVSCIGWWSCSDTNYCPNPQYPYLIKLQSNPDVHGCCLYDYPLVGPNRCIDSPTHHCSTYEGWMWTFITTLLIIVVPWIIMFLSKLIYEKCLKSQTQVHPSPTQPLYSQSQQPQDQPQQEQLRQDLLTTGPSEVPVHIT